MIFSKLLIEKADNAPVDSMSKHRSKRRLSQEDAELLKLAFSSPSDINNSQLHLSDLPCEKDISERSGSLSSDEISRNEREFSSR
jgi:hypothetical protein